MTLFSVSDPAVPATDSKAPDFALAERHKPILCLDAQEVAPPLVLGYSVMRAAGASPSSKFALTPPPGGAVIEYAIWHDWDIQHLYDLEHVWVHVEADGAVVRVEGTMHGLRVCTDTGSGLPEMQGGRPVLYSEPGKHAIWAQAHVIPFIAGEMISTVCGPEAGEEGIHLGNRFADAGAYSATAHEIRLARLALTRAAFVPSFDFAPGAEPALVPYAELERWIPARMQALIAALPERVPHLAALFLDCGDTLIDEGTEVKIDGSEIVTEAEEIPHAMDAVRQLHAEGHNLVLVADGPPETFQNLLQPRGIWDLMQGHVISGNIGELKPSPKMFAAAMDVLDLDDEARGRVVMVGNNLSRDIKGANEFGLKSLFVAWSKRRSQHPADASEVPDFTIETLDQLTAMINEIELSLTDEAHHG
ncbi:MAG: HAD family hydrolase [Maritimibacter sp.]